MHHDKSKTERIWVPQSITILMLVIALNPSNPYAYYILLRWVCCGSFVYLSVKALDQEKRNWAWVFGATAFIYNPIFHIHLNREIWTVINLITIIVAIASIISKRKNA